LTAHGAVAPVSSPRPSTAAPAGASTASRAAPGAEALAALPGAGKKGKAAGPKVTAAALGKTSPKGAGSFLDLLKAKAAIKGGPRDTAASLKIPGAKPATEDAHAVAHLAQASSAGSKSASPTEPAAKDDKASARKKLPQAQAVTTAALAVLAPASADGRKTPAPREKAAAAASPDLKPASTVTRAAAQQREPVIHIVDLRAPARRTAADPVSATTAQAQAADKDFSAALASRTAPLRDASPAPAPAPAPAAPSAFQQAPLDRFQAMAGSELLRASNLILKDGGGEIRLVLKPESLGSVRIRMNLVDNAIEGRIVVDNSSVKQVVDANMDELRRALTAQGFQPGALQVSVGGQGTDADAHRHEQPAPEVRRVTTQAFDRSVPQADTMSLGDMLVNLFV
jgi:flagellar hook-length control protein FliK